MTRLKGVGTQKVKGSKLIVVTFNYSKMASLVTIVRLSLQLNFVMGSEDMDIEI